MKIEQIIPASPGWYVHQAGVASQEVMCWALVRTGDMGDVVLPVVRSERAAGFAVEEPDEKSSLTGPDESYEYRIADLDDFKDDATDGWIPMNVSQSDDDGRCVTVLLRRPKRDDPQP